MNKKTFFILFTILSALTLGACGSSSSGGGGSVSVSNMELISVASDGTQADLTTTNYDAVPSADGRYVAFNSEATTLVANDTNGRGDIFVRDTATGTTVRISVATDGTQANDVSFSADISADGRYIVFRSYATNLVGDTNNFPDVFLHDRDVDNDGIYDEAGAIKTIRLSTNIFSEANGGSGSPTISANGRYVAFSSSATNLATDTNGSGDVFIHDRDANNNGIFDEFGFVVNSLVSIDKDGNQGNSDSFSPSISADGRYVAYISRANNLVSGDTNGNADIFVHDRDIDNDGVFDGVAIGVTRVSVDSSGSQGSDDSSQPVISADGRFVAFRSRANDLVAGDSNLIRPDIFLHDRDLDNDNIFDEPGAISTVLVSVDSAGNQSNDKSEDPTLSADGRYVAFASDADNLVTGDDNNSYDIFVHDTLSGITSLVSANQQPANDDSNYPILSADGQFITFVSYATNLVANDTNDIHDIFRSLNPL